MLLSIVVPVLNEQEAISQLLEQLSSLPKYNVEVIVVDGGSSDDTVAKASSADKVIVADKGRAKQMNAGAVQAQGDWLWFVHADTTLLADSKQYFKAITAAEHWGYFAVKLSNPALVFSVISGFINWRSGLTKVATGDQGLFVRHEVFNAVGGFEDIALMEDVALSKTLRQGYAPAMIKNLKLQTSSRRWEKHGVAKTVLLMWWLRMQYFCGVSPAKLAERYY